MPIKVTQDQIDEIIRLRDEEKYPWSRISAEAGISEKTCRKHYGLRKGEGGLHAQVFQIFDQGGGPADAVRRLKLSVEETKTLHEEYLEMKKRGKEELPVSKEFEVFKRRGSLTHLCENLLDVLDAPFEDPLADEGELMTARISFLKEKVEGERGLEGLERIRGLLESEEKEVRALLDKNRELFEERMERETEEKREWIIRRRMDRLGVSEEDARRDLVEREALFEDGLEGVYKIERRMERCDQVRNECLKYMSAADYNRLSMLFLGSLPSADYLINFWRDERDILARYGEAGWRELVRFYQIHGNTFATERPQLKKAFLTHLWRMGLQPCHYCNFLISVVGAPPQFQCPRCGALLGVAIPSA